MTVKTAPTGPVEGGIDRFLKNQLAERERNKKRVKKIAQALGGGDIVETLKKYESERAMSLACFFASMVWHKGEGMANSAARIVREYEGDTSVALASYIDCFANEKDFTEEDMDVVEGTLGDPKIVGTLKKLKEKGRKDIGELGYYLGRIAWKTGDKEAAIAVAELLPRCQHTAKDIVIQTDMMASKLGKGLLIKDLAKELSTYGDNAIIAGTTRMNRLVGALHFLNNEYAGRWEKTKRFFRRENASKTLTEGAYKGLKIMSLIGDGIGELEDVQFKVIVTDNELYRLLVDNGREAYDIVSIYVESGWRLPKPTPANYGGYMDILQDMARKVGVTKKLSRREMSVFFSLGPEDQKMVSGLINAALEERTRKYNLESGLSLEDIPYATEELLKHAVIALNGSKNEAVQKESRGIIAGVIGERLLNRSISEWGSIRKKDKEVFRRLLELNGLGDVEGCVGLLYGLGNESIGDLIDSVRSAKSPVNLGDNILTASESNNPLDYDSRVQICCCYLPRGDDVLEYCSDPRFVMAKYSIGGKPYGSAICYLTGEKGGGEKVLLVDSVEGHRVMRKGSVFDSVFEDLLWRAKEHGAKKVVFNDNGTNEAPQDFAAYLKKKGAGRGKLTLEEYDGEAYLEAFPEEGSDVEGYVIEIDLAHMFEKVQKHRRLLLKRAGPCAQLANDH